MKPLEPPASLHLEAAQGWLDLGNYLEADAELDRIPARLRAHPEVLILRLQIYEKAKKWDASIDIARAITRFAPDQPYGWFHLSYALHELGRTREAWENLLAVAEKFPREPTILYNLACYSCRLGYLPEALKLLEKVFEDSDAKRLKLMALEDRDLEPLWTRIGEL